MSESAVAEEKRLSVISVRCRDHTYLVPFNLIETIQTAPVVMPVPDSPEEVIGIAIHQGKTIPYLYLDAEEMEFQPVKCGILLKQRDGREIGMAVDEIGDLSEVSHQALEEQSEGLKYQIWRELLL